MRHKTIKHIIPVAVLLLAASCTAPKKVPYLLEAETLSTEALTSAQNVADPVINVGDLLNIQVSGSNIVALAPFNRGVYIDGEGKVAKIAPSTTGTSSNFNYEMSTEYYLVNSDGCIDFPILGKIDVVGKTKSEVSQIIVNDIYPKYVTEKPSVDIRLMNFRVTIAGAVRSPGVYTSKNERMTFMEAISMAGDLDIKGDRENILLYRTNSDGTREVHKLNIHDREFLLSPYYNLQQNDFIYVTPNSSMRQSAWQLNPAVSATLSIVGSMSSLASLIVGIINLSK